MDFIDALNWRYAVNQFSNKTLNTEQINGLIESVRLSASAYGFQPYQLFVIKNETLKRNLLPFSYGQNKVANNSHLLVFACKTSIKQNDISSFISELASNQNKDISDLSNYEQVICNDLLAQTNEEQRYWVAQQCYIALGTLLTYAAINKIDACPMTGFDKHSVTNTLELNKLGLHAEILCPVGFRSSTDQSAHRVKHRKSTTDLVTML